MTVFSVELFGPFAVSRDGVPLDVASWQRSACTLLKLLATSRNGRKMRDEVMEVLWPDASPEAAASNLRYVVSVLRRNLGGDPPPILSERGWLALNPVCDWQIDMARLRMYASEEDREALVAAVAIRRGEPLQEDRYEDWAQGERETAHRYWRDACLLLSRLEREGGDPDAAVSVLERLLDVDPLDEEAARALLASLVAAGRRAEAVRRYSQFEERLMSELGVAPAPETAAFGETARSTAPSPPTQITTAFDTPVRPLSVNPSYSLPAWGTLVGRQEALETVLRALPGDERPQEAPHLALVAAVAGSGKTRLLSEVAHIVRERGMLVLAGGSYEQEGRLAYGPIHDALLDYVRTQPPGLLRSQLDGHLTDLARVVPELSSFIPDLREPGDVEGEAIRLRLFAALSQVLERIAADIPLLVLLDDLHWADDATLQMLHYIVRQGDLTNISIVGAYREEEMIGTAQRFVDEVVRSGRAIRTELRTLSASDTCVLIGEWLGGPPAPPFLQAVDALSQGNPFFTLEILRLLQQQERLERGDEGWGVAGAGPIELPDAVRDTVAARFRLLDHDHADVLRNAAVLGREFQYPALEAMWDGDRRTLFAALDRAIATHLLAETETGYVFRHPLLREVIYEGMPLHRRAALHGAAGTALETFYGPTAIEHASELAHHFASAGPRYADQAAIYLVAAGSAAARAYAWEEALGFYRQALTLDAGAEAKAAIEERAGAILHTTGIQEDAISLFTRAAERYSSLGDLESEARVVAQIGMAHFYLGSHDAGIAIVMSTLDRMARQGVEDTLGQAQLFTSLSYLHRATGRFESGLQAAERASAIARNAGDRPVLAKADVIRADLLTAAGRFAEGRDVTREANRVAEEIGDLDVLFMGLMTVGMDFFVRGRPRESLDARLRALAIARRLGDPLRVALALSAIAQTYDLMGDIETSRGYVEEASRLAQSTQRGWVLESFARLDYIEIRESAPRDRDGWAAWVEQTLRRIERMGDLEALVAGQWNLAANDLSQERHADARGRLEPLLAHRDRLPAQAYNLILNELAEACIGLGDEQRGTELLDQAVARADEASDMLMLVEAKRLRGVLALRQERLEDAEHSLTEAMGLARGIPHPLQEGRIFLDFARLARARGELPVALHNAQTGRGILERVQANWFVEIADRLISELESENPKLEFV